MILINLYTRNTENEQIVVLSNMFVLLEVFCSHPKNQLIMGGGQGGNFAKL